MRETQFVALMLGQRGTTRRLKGEAKSMKTGAFLASEGRCRKPAFPMPNAGGHSVHCEMTASETNLQNVFRLRETVAQQGEGDACGHSW
jgi:hypothetical protein